MTEFVIAVIFKSLIAFVVPAACRAAPHLG